MRSQSSITTCMSCSTIRMVRFLPMRRDQLLGLVGFGLRSCRRSARRDTAASARWRARCRFRDCAARRATDWTPAPLALPSRPTASQRGFGLVVDVGQRAVMREHVPAVPARLRGDAHVFQHRGIGQDVGDLIGARDALAARSRWSGRPVMSSPLKMIRPLLGRSTPVRQLKKVLLPAPFGPMMA